MKKLLSNLLIYILFPLTLTVSAHSIGLPKIGGDKSSAGGNLEDTKLKFTKVFFESSLEYMEAQAYLFDALEMNDEASKTRKSIEFVKNEKNKEGKRLTNAFNSVSENSKSIEGALTKEAATSAEAKVAYAKSLPHAVKGLIGTVKLPPEAKALLDTLKADKMAALKMGDFMKVLPKIPQYVSSATTVGKLVVTGAKSRGVEGADDATAAMGGL
ncbi:hypothetical protein N9N62_00315 [Candidatus Pelagibacter bacterium]|nr:hypothetical protein [Candidatus Pelagibacter bacterium]MDA8800733.1 hypothetical protein [Candidatus Pelagibacter bacterium]